MNYLKFLNYKLFIFIIITSYFHNQSILYLRDSMIFLFSLTTFYMLMKFKTISQFSIYFLILILFILIFYIIAFSNEINAVSNLYSINGLKQIAYALISLLFIFSILNINYSYKKIILILKVILICSFVSSVLNILNWAINTQFTFGRYNYVPYFSGSQGLQFYSTFIGVLISIYLHKIKEINYLSLVFFILTIYLSLFTILVREAWLISTIALVFAFKNSGGIKINKVNNIKIFIYMCFIFSLLIYLGNQLNLFSDIDTIENSKQGGSVLIRFLLIKDVIESIKFDYLFGVGFGAFPIFFNLEIITNGGQIVTVSSPHNGLILLFCEIGIIGVLYVVFLNFKILKLKSNNTHQFFYPFILLLILNQITSNSLFLPPISERTVFSFSIILWFIVKLLSLKKKEFL